MSIVFGHTEVVSHVVHAIPLNVCIVFKPTVNMLHEIHSENRVEYLLLALLFIYWSVHLAHTLNNRHVVTINIISGCNRGSPASLLKVVLVTELSKLFPHCFW